jgi:hypothetical protein
MTLPDPNGFKEMVALLSIIEDKISRRKRQEQFLRRHSGLNILERFMMAAEESSIGF